MPRIDPIQLLNCLSVLLSPNGGIKSTDEVMRLVKLMTKFSKKLVSKCIYIQVLKCTETELLGLFMGSGGWNLVHMWLTESIVAKNWPLVRELLELLLLCPVDTDRLKTNNCPKLIKELSKDGNYFAIRALASKLVEQWLKTVKSEPVEMIKITDIPQIIADAELELNNIAVKNEVVDHADKKPILHTDKSCIDSGYNGISQESLTNGDSDIKVNEEINNESEPLPVLKISMKDGKQIISQVDDKEIKSEKAKDSKHKENKVEAEEKDKHKSRSKDKDRSHSKSSSKSSSSKHSSKSSSSSDKSKKEHSSSSSRDKSKDKHSSHSSSKKSRHESSSSKKSSSSSNSSSSSKSKEERSKEGSERKDKPVKDDKSKEEKAKDASKPAEKVDTQIKSPMSIQKLGKIPKLSDVKREKPSISIEVRKPDEPKPKTVKTFHSKFRRHGLEEEVKPPPSRATILNKKVIPAVPPPIPVPKRPSPVHNESPPEKKPKTTEIVEKPGAIKLIPPKPKPMLLLESDMFMDALNASATNKKEPRKRKRRTSGSKDGNPSGDASPPQTPTSTSPNSESKATPPPRFYQDTLETEEEKEKEEKEPEIEIKEEKIEVPEPHTQTVNGLKGVLCYHKKKGPKKSIKWKPEPELEEIQYFELDETERVNVTKTFTDMKYLERIHEREAFQKGRNLSNDDVMEEKTNWRPLIPIDLEGQIHVDYGKNSKEKDIQAIRQKGTLQPLYFHKSMIPDSPLEAELETHTYTEPTIIPLEDVTGNQDNISDFRNMPWPEPKGNAPPASSNVSVPSMFPPAMAPFPNTFPPAQFPGMPGFQAPGMVPEWPSGMPGHLMPPNGMPMNPAALAPGAIAPGNIPPGMMISPDGMMMTPEMFGAPNAMFPVPDGFPMQQNVFPPDFNMAGPPGPEGFPGNNFRGGMRGRGGPGHWRGKGPGSWDGPPRGRGGSAHSRGGSRKSICIYFQRKGSCRQGDNCTFLHPGVNCPY